MSAPRNRVAGHGLRYEGRPVMQTGCCGERTDHGQRSYCGDGHGICSCGAISAHMQATSARQAWHREHKAEVTA